MSKNDSSCYRTKNTNVVQMLSFFFKFNILGTIQANYIHYKMINIFLCCNGRPLLGSHLNWWEVIQRQPGDCVIVDKHGVKVFLFPFVCRLYTRDKLLSLHHDQPELIGAEEIIFYPSPLLSLWITSCGWKNYTDQFQFLPLRQQNCNLTDFCIFLPGFYLRQGTPIYNFNSGSRLNLLCWMLFGYFIKEKWKFSIINFMYFEVFGHSTKLHGSIKNWWVEGQIYISDDFDQIYLLINFTYMNRQYSDLEKIIYDPIEILLCLNCLT